MIISTVIFVAALAIISSSVISTNQQVDRLSRQEELAKKIELKVGELSYRKGNSWTSLAVAWGCAEVLPDQVRVLAETAERAHEIDLERATRAKERAEQRLSRGGDDVDYDRARISLQRALIRIQVARKGPSAA